MLIIRNMGSDKYLEFIFKIFLTVTFIFCIFLKKKFIYRLLDLSKWNNIRVVKIG